MPSTAFGSVRQRQNDYIPFNMDSQHVLMHHQPRHFDGVQMVSPSALHSSNNMQTTYSQQMIPSQYLNHPGEIEMLPPHFASQNHPNQQLMSIVNEQTYQKPLESAWKYHTNINPNSMLMNTNGYNENFPVESVINPNEHDLNAYHQQILHNQIGLLDQNKQTGGQFNQNIGDNNFVNLNVLNNAIKAMNVEPDYSPSSAGSAYLASNAEPFRLTELNQRTHWTHFIPPNNLHNFYQSSQHHPHQEHSFFVADAASPHHSNNVPTPPQWQGQIGGAQTQEGHGIYDVDAYSNLFHRNGKERMVEEVGESSMPVDSGNGTEVFGEFKAKFHHNFRL